MERVDMQAVDVQSWRNVSDTVFVPQNEAEYERLVSMLDGLIHQVGEDESHPARIIDGRDICSHREL